MNSVVLTVFVVIGLLMGGGSILFAFKAEKGLDKVIGWFFGVVCLGGALICFLITRSS